MPEEKQDESTYSFKIENVVGTVVLEIQDKIDLNKIARKYFDVEYNPERFPGLVMRIKKPKATILLFSTGKMVITGLRKASQAESVTTQALEKIKSCDIDVKNPQITIQNIVASGDLNCLVDLNMGAVIMEYSMYEPEVFPGLIYRMQEPRAVFLIFSTGRIVCTGAKNKEAVAKAVEKLYHEIRDAGITREESDEPDFFEEEMTFL
jgi:transcription initiation factor TFIID TATA-box-binding protein